MASVGLTAVASSVTPSRVANIMIRRSVVGLAPAIQTAATHEPAAVTAAIAPNTPPPPVESFLGQQGQHHVHVLAEQSQRGRRTEQRPHRWRPAT
jgi:hypothetical protein